MKLAKNLERLGTETAFSVLAEAKKLEAQGKEMIHLGLGQPDFKTPQHIMDAAKKAIDDGHHGYVLANGITECRQAVSRKIKSLYKKDVDELVPNKLNYDWEELREDILEYGLRHSTLSAQMPSESSSVVSNATNGIEPPRDLISTKKSKKGPLKQVVPQYATLKNNYTLLWDMPGNTGYINIVAVMQKFFDQAISGNWSYNPLQYENSEVPTSVMAQDLLTTFKYGWKTSYYQNTYDTKSDIDEPAHPIGWKDDVPEDNNKAISNLLEDIFAEQEEACDSCAI